MFNFLSIFQGILEYYKKRSSEADRFKEKVMLQLIIFI